MDKIEISHGSVDESLEGRCGNALKDSGSNHAVVEFLGIRGAAPRACDDQKESREYK